MTVERRVFVSTAACREATKRSLSRLVSGALQFFARLEEAGTLSVAFPDRRGREKSSHARAHWPGWRPARGRLTFAFGRADSRSKLTIKGRTDREETDRPRCVTKGKGERKGPSGYRKRKWARTPVSSRSYDVDDPRGADGHFSLLRLRLFLRPSPPLDLRLSRELARVVLFRADFVVARFLDRFHFKRYRRLLLAAQYSRLISSSPVPVSFYPAVLTAYNEV